MKKKFLLFIVFLSLNCQSQVWCTPGSVWHYKDNHYYGQGYTRMEYLADTVINGKTYNKIKQFKIGQNISGYYNSTTYLYTRTSNNVVYHVGDDTLYNFNATVGDKWRIRSQDINCANSYVTVIDTGHILIQGQNLKWFWISPTNQPPNTKGIFAGYVYERMGAMNMSPYEFGNLCAPSIHWNHTGALLCFSDHQITEYKHNNYSSPCDVMFVSVEDLQLDPDLFLLFPNPGQGLFTFHLELPGTGEPVSVNIMDLLGRSLMRIDLEPGRNEHPIDSRELSNGVYVVSLIRDKEVVHTIKVLKQD
jgi:hypothetical protein